MDLTNTFSGIISDIVKTTTQYMRHYVGNVIDNNDPDKRGKVLVEVPELQWIGDEAVWCFPRFLHEFKLPKVGEPVEVYFIDSDMNRPVWLGLAGELVDGIPAGHSGAHTEVYIYDNPKTRHGIRYDESTGKMIIDFTELEVVLGATEFMVLGTALETFLKTHITTYFNAHVHTSAAPGAPTSAPVTPAVEPANILSTVAKVK